MAVKKRVNKAKESLTDAQWDFLRDKYDSDDKSDPFRWWALFSLKYDIRKTNEQLWNLHRDVILAEQVKENPGTRPALWWEFDAPRQPFGTMPGWYCDGKLPELRQRLGGRGKPVSPTNLSYGIPDVWCGIDENDPPVLESQSAYLKRHGLFLPGEEKRADFDPEAVPKSWDWFPDRISD